MLPEELLGSSMIIGRVRRVRVIVNGICLDCPSDFLGLRSTRCLERMGIKGSLHGLRHTHVFLLIKTGLPINAISARVGHANPSITHNIYAQRLPGMNRMVVDVFERLSEAKASTGAAIG